MDKEINLKLCFDTSNSSEIMRLLIDLDQFLAEIKSYIGDPDMRKLVSVKQDELWELTGKLWESRSVKEK